jgi:urease accessory protein UreF
MASKEPTTVLEELIRQGELNRREHLLNRREHRLNRRAYEEGMAVCVRAIEEVVDMNVKALLEMSRQIRDSVDEQRAQRQALFQVIDRMDRLDGGATAG